VSHKNAAAKQPQKLTTPVKINDKGAQLLWSVLSRLFFSARRLKIFLVDETADFQG
jgi:hypothetical protein